MQDPVQRGGEGRGGGFTVQQRSQEIDALVPIPQPFAIRFHHLGDILRLQLLQPLQDPAPAAEPDDDFGHPEQEGLDPELHQLALVCHGLPVVRDLCGRFELDPVDRCVFVLGLGVPYYEVYTLDPGQGEPRVVSIGADLTCLRRPLLR